MNIEFMNILPIVIAHLYDFELTAEGGLPQDACFRPLTPTAMIDRYLLILIA